MADRLLAFLVLEQGNVGGRVRVDLGEGALQPLVLELGHLFTAAPVKRRRSRSHEHPSSSSVASASDQKMDSCRSSQAPTFLLTSSTAVTPCTAAACASHSASGSRSVGERAASAAAHAPL